MTLKVKILIPTLAVLCILGIAANSRTSSARTREEAVSWTTSQINKSLDYDGMFGAQCVDLIKYYYAYFGVAGYAKGNANVYMTNSLPPGWTRVYGNYQPGDVAVWKTNHSCSTCRTDGLGHVGIITSADSVGFNAVNQNYSGKSYCTQNWFYCSALACAIRPAFQSSDKTNPTISNIRITDVNRDGYTVVCNVSDNVGVTRVSFPSWNMDKHNGNDAIWLQGTVSGGTASCRVNISSLRAGLTEGNYLTHIYAYDAAGNSCAASTSSVYIDRTAPKISDAKILSQDAKGYYIQCKVTDNRGVNRVQCPTWTINNGQDDLAKDWWTNTAVKANKVTADTYRFRVDRAAHNNEAGPYCTHLYAYDNAGNAVCYSGLPAVTLSDTPEPKNTVQYRDKILAVYDENMSWSEMKTLAEKMNGQLVAITDAEKQKAVESLLKNRLRGYYYIGCWRSGKDAEWQWLSGDKFSYQNWHPMQPDCAGNNEFYGSVIPSSGKWNDLPSAYSDSGFIIEIPVEQKAEGTVEQPSENSGEKESVNDIETDEDDDEEAEEDLDEEKLQVGKARIKSLNNLKKKRLKVSVRSVQDADYYQYKIGTNKSMTKNKKTLSTGTRTATFKNLKKKTYYVKVRGYAYENGKKVYGEWSAVKKIKIKK